MFPNWRDHASPCSNDTFSSCECSFYPVAVVQMVVVFPHTQVLIRIQAEFVVMGNVNPKYLILDDECLRLYEIGMAHSQEKSFTIRNDNTKKFFALRDRRPILPIYRDMVPEDNLQKQQENKKQFMIEESIKEAGFGPKLNKNPSR